MARFIVQRLNCSGCWCPHKYGLTVNLTCIHVSIEFIKKFVKLWLYKEGTITKENMFLKINKIIYIESLKSNFRKWGRNIESLLLYHPSTRSNEESDEEWVRNEPKHFPNKFQIRNQMSDIFESRLCFYTFCVRNPLVPAVYSTFRLILRNLHINTICQCDFDYVSIFQCPSE